MTRENRLVEVIVILGIWFFYQAACWFVKVFIWQVWGVPGMLLSVPLLAVVRTWDVSFKSLV